MHTITFFPKSKVTLDDARAFVESCASGCWVANTPTFRGVIESGNGRVYLDYDPDYFSYAEKYEDKRSQDELAARLGFPPTIAIYLHASNKYQDSKELAQTICQMLVDKWGGILSE